jgi:hypothetical protein
MILLNIIGAMVWIAWAAGALTAPSWLPTMAYVLIAMNMLESAIRRI